VLYIQLDYKMSAALRSLRDVLILTTVVSVEYDTSHWRW